MSQYIGLNEIGKRLKIYYQKFLERSDLPVVDVASIPSWSEQHSEYKIIREMEKQRLVKIDEKPGTFGVYLTERGKRHGAELHKILDSIPKLE
ncbi:MAG TPA: hypothetical protein VJJ76_03560 [archaeon]|nr:hypothetical protein [archaeon]